MSQEYRFFEHAVPLEMEKAFIERLDQYRKVAQYMKGSDTVLDVGCSSGYGARVLNDCTVYHGVDQEKESIEYAKANYGRFPNLHFHWNKALTFLKRVPNRHYDVVICLDMLHENPGMEREILEELVRVCNRELFIAVRETPEFRMLDAHEIIRRRKPEMDYRELLSGKVPLHSVTRI